MPVVGDCAMSLEGLHEVLRTRDAENPHDWEASHAAWLGQLREWHDARPLTYSSDGDSLKP